MPPRTQIEDPSAVQDRLLEMLDSVQVDQGTEPTADGDAGCPHCKSTEPWGTSPWCPKCGFYPKLNRVLEGVGEEPVKSEPAANGEPNEEQAADTETVKERDQEIEKIEHGLTFLFVAVLLFVPAAILSALYFLGVDLKGILVTAGLLPKPAAVASDENENSRSDKESNRQSAEDGKANVEPASGKNSASPGPATDSRSTADGQPQFAAPLGEHRKDFSEFIVFGFTTNAEGELRSVLIAQFTEDGRGRFAGRLGTDETRSTLVKKLSEKLATIRTPYPALPCPYGGNWVKPILRCRVAHDGWTFDKRVNDGEIVGYYEKPLP